MVKDADRVSDQEMLDDFKTALHKDLKAGKLGATALVTGLKAISAMIPPAPPEAREDDVRFSVIDQLDSLPKAEGRKLLKQEIARYRALLVSHEEALTRLEGNHG